MRQLNTEQARAVKHFNGPMLVLAGPGSGKTFTLVERIRYLIEARGVAPNSILTITFSKKASVEMKTRFYDLIGDKYYPVTFGTFHSVFYNILKTYHNYTTDSILTPNDKIKYMKRTLRKLKIEAPDSDDFAINMLSKISAYKAGGEDNFENEDKRAEFMRIYDAYDRDCRINGKLDFDDMIVLCYRLLKENESALKKWQGIFKYFLVDEFQDINDIQYEILMLLAGDEKNIFAVGDDDQSIYGFRGSKPSLMKRFLELEGCQVTDMYKNYRCAEDVITAAGCLIANNKERIVKNQISCKDDKDGAVYTGIFLSEKEEADFVINKLKELEDSNGNIESTAVLYRTERCVAYLEEQLKAAGIEYERSVKNGGFYDEDWVKDIISYMKIAVGQYETSDIYRILNKPDRGISREEVSCLHNAVSQQQTTNNIPFTHASPAESSLHNLITGIHFISSLPCFAAVTYIFKGLGYYKYLLRENLRQGRDRSATDEMMDEILMRAKNFTTISDWLDHIEYLSENPTGQAAAPETTSHTMPSATTTSTNPNHAATLHATLTLQTAHASKGLEYENVFIIGLMESLFPHHKAKSEDETEEERRLMYVAMTRAKRNLYILGRGSADHGKHISRFVSEVKNCGKTIDIGV